MVDIDIPDRRCLSIDRTDRHAPALWIRVTKDRDVVCIRPAAARFDAVVDESDILLEICPVRNDQPAIQDPINHQEFGTDNPDERIEINRTVAMLRERTPRLLNAEVIELDSAGEDSLAKLARRAGS